MTPLRDVSIRRKLTAIILLSSTLALLFTGAFFAVYVFVQSRQAMVTNVGTFAEILAENSSAALLFDDRDAAADLLASVRATGEIENAVLYDATGETFAVFLREVGDPITPLGSDGYEFTRDRLRLQRVVEMDGERLGSIYLEHSLERLWSQLRLFAWIMAAVLFGSLVLVALLSSVLQRAISAPLLRLAATAEEVAESRDYTLRATKTGRDEIGALIDRFNQMLEQIQTRDWALQDAHSKLEERVAERTAELEREVTERRRVEEELRQFTTDLERSNRDLQDFAYVASHDLQEPLRKIQAFGDRLETIYSESLDDRGRDYLARMRSAAGRMRTLISDLLAFSRVTTKAKPAEPVDLDEVIDDIAKMLELQIEESGVEFEVGELGFVSADPSQMRQLFQNLISNAIKFRNSEGTPRVTVKLDELSSPAGCSRVIVEDNGIGIEERYHERIFGVFQRLHSREQYEGSGMGLSICRKIAERHKGTVTVESQLGKGTRFIVDLPAVAGEAVEKDDSEQPTPAGPAVAGGTNDVREG